MVQEQQAHTVASSVRRPLRPLPVVAVLLAICLGGLLAGHLWRGHDNADREARLIASTLGQAIEQHVVGQFRGISALLDEAGVIVQTGHVGTDSVQEHLRERLTAFPEISGLILLTADGRQTALQGDETLPPAQVSWLLGRLRGGASLVVGAPQQVAGSRRLVVARLFPFNGGTAAVVTWFDTDILAAYLETLRVAETESLTVLHASAVVAAAPDNVQSFARPMLPQADSLGALRPMENLDLTVWVGIDRDLAFRLWRTNAVLQTVLFGLFCLALYLWARRSDQAWRQVEAVRDGLEEQVARRGVELQQARALLEQRARRVSAANRELQRLSMVAAHHLQEPLRPLVSYSQMLGRLLPVERFPGIEVLSHLIQGGKDMKTLLKGFQQRVAALSIDAPAEAAELHQVMQRAMVDAAVGVPIRPEPLPTLSVQPRATGELLVQMFRTLDGLGCKGIGVSAVNRQGGWKLEVRAVGSLPDDVAGTVAVRVCLSLASLHDLTLMFEDGAFVLDLPVPETAAAAPAQLPEPPQARREMRARVQAVGLVLALGAAVLWQVERERDLAIHAAQVLTRAVANSIDQQISGSLRGIDTILAEVETAVEAGRHEGMPFSVRMEAVLRAFPEVSYVGLADATGRMAPLVWPPRLLPEDVVDVAGRAYFRRAKDAEHAGMVVGDPVRGMISGDRSWHLARPLRDGKGRFAGVVYANVNPDHYARFLDRVLLDQEGGTALIGANGLMISRAPAHAEKFGMNIASSDLFTRWLPEAPIGTAHLISKADGNDKYLAYRLLSPYPLVVTSAVSRNKALTEWRQGVNLTVAVASLLALVLFVLAWRVDRGMRRMRRQHARLEAEIDQRTQGLETARALSDARAASLDRLNTQLRELLGVVTEELEVPLAALQRDVATLTGLLADSADGRGGDELHYVAAAIGRLAALLRDFQRFVSVVSTSPSLGPVDLEALIRLVADDMARRFGAGVLVVDAEGLPEIVADATMMMELLGQLFANAITYRGRAEAVTVRVRVMRRPRDWLLQVSDDGPGLSREQLSHDPQAFEAVAGQAPDSTGIGLAICRVIAQAHGGDLWLGNGPDGGAEVSVVLGV